MDKNACGTYRLENVRGLYFEEVAAMIEKSLFLRIVYVLEDSVLEGKLFFF